MDCIYKANELHYLLTLPPVFSRSSHYPCRDDVFCACRRLLSSKFPITFSPPSLRFCLNGVYCILSCFIVGTCILYRILGTYYTGTVLHISGLKSLHL